MKIRQTPTSVKNTFGRGLSKLIIGSFAFVVLYFAAAGVAMADVSTCANIGSLPFPNGQDSYEIEKDNVRYFGPINSSSTNSRAGFLNGQFRVNLQGWLYYKRSASGEVRNSKVLIYNHGHNKEREEPCEIVNYFVGQGYVVFAPLRRGHISEPSDKDGWFSIESTGIHLDRYITLCLRQFPVPQGADRPHLHRLSNDCRLDTVFGGQENENAIETDYLRRQRTDIQEQINYILGRTGIGTGGAGKLANPNRISLLGHSYGGSAVILANAEDYGQNATIAVSAAEKSWDNNPYWQIELSNAMLSQAKPIYMLQPKNGRSLEPTKVLYGIAIDKKYRSQAAIFPKAPWNECDENDPDCSPEWEQAHGTFILEREQVRLWGPSAKNFMFRHPR